MEGLKRKNLYPIFRYGKRPPEGARGSREHRNHSTRKSGVRLFQFPGKAAPIS
jgi:hypothetical protein